MVFTPPTLGSEAVMHIGGFAVRNSMLMGWIAMVVLIVGALIFKKKSDRLVPKGLQNFVESIIELLFNFFNSVTQDRNKTKKFFPIVATIFIFIIASNWMGVLPGVGSIGFYEEGVFIPYFRSAYADVNMTLALALISVVLTQIFGIASLGFFHYAGKFFVNPLKDPIGCFVGFLELISELAKVISFTFRLFGNIFAGEVLLMTISFLAPYLAPIPFYGLELFVGFIQALVFAVLTLVFINGAITSHHEEAHAT